MQPRASALLYWLLYSRPQPSCSMARTDGVGPRQPIAPATTASTEVGDRHGLSHFHTKPCDQACGYLTREQSNKIRERQRSYASITTPFATQRSAHMSDARSDHDFQLHPTTPALRDLRVTVPPESPSASKRVPRGPSRSNAGVDLPCGNVWAPVSLICRPSTSC